MRGKSDYGGNRGSRGGYRGRGGFQNRMGNQGPNRYFKSNPKPFIPHVSFDLIQAEQSFPRVKPVQPQEEKTFHEALTKRVQDLTPSTNEHTHLVSLVTRVQTILDTLVQNPGDFESCQLDEIKQVGPFKNGTLLMSDKLTADVCVVLKTLPTREAVASLANKVFEEMKKVVVSPELETLNLEVNERGFKVVSGKSTGITCDLAVQVLVTTQQQNIRKLEASLHCKSEDYYLVNIVEVVCS